MECVMGDQMPAVSKIMLLCKTPLFGTFKIKGKVVFSKG